MKRASEIASVATGRKHTCSLSENKAKKKLIFFLLSFVRRASSHSHLGILGDPVSESRLQLEAPLPALAWTAQTASSLQLGLVRKRCA
jgi:hypothetical protein